MTYCQVQGCDGKPEVEVELTRRGFASLEHDPHGQAEKDTKLYPARICAGHKAVLDRAGRLPVVIPDDAELYFAEHSGPGGVPQP